MAPRAGWELGSLRKQAVGAPAKRDSSGDDTWALATGYRFLDFMLHRVARRAAVTRGRFFDFMLHRVTFAAPECPWMGLQHFTASAGSLVGQSG